MFFCQSSRLGIGPWWLTARSRQPAGLFAAGTRWDLVAGRKACRIIRCFTQLPSPSACSSRNQGQRTFPAVLPQLGVGLLFFSSSLNFIRRGIRVDTFYYFVLRVPRSLWIPVSPSFGEAFTKIQRPGASPRRSSLLLKTDE